MGRSVQYKIEEEEQVGQEKGETEADREAKGGVVYSRVKNRQQERKHVRLLSCEFPKHL